MFTARCRPFHRPTPISHRTFKSIINSTLPDVPSRVVVHEIKVAARRREELRKVAERNFTLRAAKRCVTQLRSLHHIKKPSARSHSITEATA